jgi:metal-dependent amidase/aminoacylase/carboxypeptidase family protein
MKTKYLVLVFAVHFSFSNLNAQSNDLETQLKEVEQKVIDWCRDIHQNSELENREFRTAAMFAKHLESLRIVVQTKVGILGGVCVLKGGKQAPLVALRVDMDALPVLDRTVVPFAFKVRTIYDGKETAVMHACGIMLI